MGQNDNGGRLTKGAAVVTLQTGGGLEVKNLRDPINITITTPSVAEDVLASKGFSPTGQKYYKYSAYAVSKVNLAS